MTDVDDYISQAESWQKTNLELFRTAVHQAAPNVAEAFKWSVPVFTLNGKLLCAMSTFKDHTKFNFFKGAALSDPDDLFNSGLDSKDHRSINLAEGQTIAPEKLQAVIVEAAAKL